MIKNLKISGEVRYRYKYDIDYAESLKRRKVNNTKVSKAKRKKRTVVTYEGVKYYHVSIVPIRCGMPVNRFKALCKEGIIPPRTSQDFPNCYTHNQYLLISRAWLEVGDVKLYEQAIRAMHKKWRI